MADSSQRAGNVKGLIRVISFDASREVTNQDLQTLRLMGEHLANRTQAALYALKEGLATLDEANNLL